MSENTQENITPVETDEAAKFKGRYIVAVGRRKTAVASVRIYKKGTGAIQVNGLPAKEYLPSQLLNLVRQPLKLTGFVKDLNISVAVNGGGKKGQAEAIRHGITRALIEMQEDLKPALRSKGWVTRDARKKERKKPGLKKARRAPQWSKR